MSGSQQAKGAGSKRAGADEPPRQRLLGAGGIGEAWVNMYGDGQQGLQGARSLWERGYPSLSCPANPTDGVGQDLLSGSLGKSWAGVTQSP